MLNPMNCRTNTSLTRAAADNFKAGNYSQALDLYKQLSKIIGNEFFAANIKLCLKRLNSTGPDGLAATDSISAGVGCVEINESGVPKVLIFSNINLSVIDGSAVFVANLCNLFQQMGANVHLLTCNEVGENWRERVSSFNELQIFRCESAQIKKEILKLDAEANYDWIVARTWGDRNLWFDFGFCNKLIYYWPLQLETAEEDRKIYSSVRMVGFQTELLKQKVFQQLGPKDALLLPPLIESRKTRGSRTASTDGVVRLSYTGTLRPECYSIEMLNAVESVIAEDERVHFHLAIGKIFYKDLQARLELNAILDRLRLNSRVTIETQVPASRCDEILFASDISFSLWEPVPQNLYQISTKLLECLKEGCYVICFETPLYRKELGVDYPCFINDISELRSALKRAILRQRNGGRRYINSYLLSKYSFEAHAVRISNNLALPLPLERKKWIERQLFSKQFDKIYGLYVDDNERAKIAYLAERKGIEVFPFKGVNGEEELREQFSRYLQRPLSGEWEIAAKRKRLSVGAFGHLASFISIAKDALKNNYKKILILEADAIFHKNIFYLNSVSSPSDFKIWYLGAGKWEPAVSYTSDGHFYYPNKTTGTFAIAFDVSILEECIEEWQKFVDPTDVALWKITDRYREQCFVSCPNLIICSVAKSKTTTPRSQVEISRRFGWHLSEYDVGGVEYIGKNVVRVKVTLDHYLPGSWLKFLGDGINWHINVLSDTVEVEINGFIESLSYAGLFIRSIEYTS